MAEVEPVVLRFHIQDTATPKVDKANQSMNRFQRTLNQSPRSAGRFRSAMRRVGVAAAAVRSKVLGLTGGITALAAAYAGFRIGKTFISQGAVVEKLQLQLRQITGTMKEGNQVFQNSAKFASQVAFQYEELLKAAAMLRATVAGTPAETQKALEITADIAATFGLTLEESAGQIIRAFSAGIGAADLFREKGVSNALGFQSGMQVSAEETRRVFIQEFEKMGSFFRGTSKELGSTWEGLMSLISDKWFQFRGVVNDAGLFDQLKSGLSAVNEAFGEFIEDNRAGIIEFTQGAMKDLNDAIELLRRNWDEAKAAAEALGTTLKALGLAGLVIVISSLVTWTSALIAGILLIAPAVGFFAEKWKTDIVGLKEFTITKFKNIWVTVVALTQRGILFISTAIDRGMLTASTSIKLISDAFRSVFDVSLFIIGQLVTRSINKIAGVINFLREKIPGLSKLIPEIQERATENIGEGIRKRGVEALDKLTARLKKFGEESKKIEETNARLSAEIWKRRNDTIEKNERELDATLSLLGFLRRQKDELDDAKATKRATEKRLADERKALKESFREEINGAIRKESAIRALAEDTLRKKEEIFKRENDAFKAAVEERIDLIDKENEAALRGLDFSGGLLGQAGPGAEAGSRLLDLIRSFTELNIEEQKTKVVQDENAKRTKAIDDATTTLIANAKDEIQALAAVGLAHRIAADEIIAAADKRIDKSNEETRAVIQDAADRAAALGDNVAVQAIAAIQAGRVVEKTEETTEKSKKTTEETAINFEKFATATTGVLGIIGSAFNSLGQSLAALGEGGKAKSFMLAAAIANTALAITAVIAAFSNAAVVSFLGAPAAIAAGFATAGLVAAAGAAQIATIRAQKFHEGGFVTSPVRGGDVPIIAQEGEFVVPRREAAIVAAAFGGGGVGDGSGGEGIEIVNVLDPVQFDNWANSRRGRKVLVNVIRESRQEDDFDHDRSSI